MHKTLLFSLLLACGLGGHPADLLAQTSATADDAVMVAPALRIGISDLLDVSIFDSSDLSGRFRVNEKGEIHMPLLGSVSVAGLTVEEAQSLIERSFVQADILTPTSAHVTVNIAEYATQGITVTGEVHQPGIYPSMGVRILLDLITAAGGENTTAGKLVVIKRKSDPDHPICVEFNASAPTPIVAKVQIFPGDTIFVPAGGAVYAVGNFNHQGAYPLQKDAPLTAVRLLAVASGSGSAAALKHAQLVRTFPDGHKEAIFLNLSNMLKGKSADFALQTEDILFIPTNHVKLVSLQAITSLTGVGTNYMTYHFAYK